MAEPGAGPKIWVFVEQDGGRAHPVSWELLGAATGLAEQLAGGVVEAVLLGHAVQAIVPEAFAYGADRVYCSDDPLLAHYRNLPYAIGVSQLVQAHQPEIFLVGATHLGRDLASSIATRVRTGLTADCTELSIDPQLKILAATRPTFGGNLMATILCRQRRPQMATVRPRVLPLPERQPGRSGELVRAELGLREADMPVRLLGFEPAAGGADIEYADVIVAGGRGVGGPEGFARLAELAEALGGVVGASRPVVDAGWIGYEHQVGQTGKTVRPKLYLAAGISGAVQHRVGMSGADFILAINRDPEAPIFQVADLGIVGDVAEVVPELIRQLRARTAGAQGGSHA